MSKQSTLESVIKSSVPVVKESSSPAIVVGLPRSGSSYLSHVLCNLDNWFVYDDLYPYQKAQSLGISPQFNLAEDKEKLEAFLSLLTWHLRGRIRYQHGFYVPDLTWDDTFDMEKALVEALDGDRVVWTQVLEEWCMRLALYSGKERWGYKTPQDFMHMDELTNIFPGVRFIYVMRDPRKVMRSFKNLPRVRTQGTEDGESRQYHPVVYSLYWKNAYEKVQDFISRGRAPVETVKFEDLIKTPNEVAGRLANFLDTKVIGDVALEKGNSSFDGDKASKTKELTGTEVMLCEKIAGSCMQAAGYELSSPTPQVLDIFDLIGTSADFTIYKIKKIVKDKRNRDSAVAFLKSLISKK